MNIGEKIKNIRISHNMTQEQLSDLSGISLPSIRKYEAGDRNPKSDQLLKISKALGVSINLFLEFDIRTVSDLLSLIFRMNDQTDMRIEADKDDTGTYIPRTVHLAFTDERVNQKLCAYLSVLQEKTELEQCKTTLSEEDYLNQIESINKKISNFADLLLDDNTPLDTKISADLSMPDTISSDKINSTEDTFSFATNRELQDIFFDCTADEMSLLIENARLLKNFLRQKRT